MNVRSVMVLAAIALAGVAAWPSFVATREAQASAQPAPAPVLADYEQRDRLVTFYEGAVRRHPDQLVTRMLASQYLQRFREHGDAGDLLRGEHAAEQSLAFQPRFNVAGEMTLASALVSSHRFRTGLSHAQRALEIEPGNPAVVAQVASTDVELGRYDDANRLLRAAHAGYETNVALDTASARYDEQTGNLAAARRSIDRALVEMDSVMDNPAESRAWYHVRAGELAWTAGDGATAERRLREALDIFPNYARAWNGLARLYWGERRWPETLDAASRAAKLVPLPETLGYEADAQRALGDGTAARATDDLIDAIARIGNSGGVNDRALALYLADHGRRLDDAIAIARRDVAARDDVFAQDTLAWVLVRGGRCDEARDAARKAVARNTQDARLQYHAGTIALACGDHGEGARRLRAALDLNPQFHPLEADDARAKIAPV
ncbi:MAG TPA: tetratricopeptide repeat protein, partial [Candidatus Elarobacter sp.]|nr:tetratricopeptide repeat protein [Candidatus Elarobacter sp.]